MRIAATCGPRALGRPGLAAGLVSLLALVAGTGTTACTGSTAEAAVRTGPEDRLDGFWWTFLGEQSTAVANFGPLVRTRDDGFARRWSLVIHTPGTLEPLSCLQGVVLAGESYPVSANGAFFAVDLRPGENRTWGEVESDADLDVFVEGLY